MDNPLIFGYRLDGVKTGDVTRKVRGYAVLDVCVSVPARVWRDPAVSKGEVF
jgi:hypothetical protein